jgi:UDP-glucose 4-epimerase
VRYPRNVRVLITGGAGFIGSHLVDSFEARGCPVTVLDNFYAGNSKNLNNFRGRFVQGDIRDQALVENLVKENDSIFHMAASLGVERILREPLESISTNIYGSEVVLRAATKFKKRIFIASTSEIYGKNPKQPLSESDDRVIGNPQNFRWSYSDAKAIEEAIARALHLQSELAVTTIRFFNTVGPRQTGMYGMVVPRFVGNSLKNEELRVFGDGNQTRVFCHVMDAVAGVLSLFENEKSIGEVYNIGGKGEISILELAEKVIKITDSNSVIKKIEYSEAYPEGYEDMQRRVPNISKIQSLTGWNPKYGIEDIIEDVASYLKN